VKVEEHTVDAERENMTVDAVTGMIGATARLVGVAGADMTAVEMRLLDGGQEAVEHTAGVVQQEVAAEPDTG
jgi:hypothetical protein